MPLEIKIVVDRNKKFWDSERNVFVKISEDVRDMTLLLEHSLVSISKWESETHKPFLVDEQKTQEQIILYIKCMTITQNVPDDEYLFLSQTNINDIKNYIQDSKTATWFSDKSNQGNYGSRKQQTITSELVYGWMTQLEIPWEAQKWHLNRLLTLIRVLNELNKPADKKNKTSKRDMASHYAKLNAQRRAQTHSAG